MHEWKNLSNTKEYGAKLNLAFFQIKSFLKQLDINIYLGTTEEFVNLHYHTEELEWYKKTEIYKNPRNIAIFFKRNDKILGGVTLNPMDLPPWMSIYHVFETYMPHYFGDHETLNIPDNLRFIKGSVLYISGMWVTLEFTKLIERHNKTNYMINATWLLSTIGTLYALTYEDADFLFASVKDYNLKHKELTLENKKIYQKNIIERYDWKESVCGPVWKNLFKQDEVQSYTIWIDKTAMYNSITKLTSIISNKMEHDELTLETRLK